MYEKKQIIYVADFETLAEPESEFTWVWGGTAVMIHQGEYSTDEVLYFHSIEEFFDFVERETEGVHISIYFHNLKFDGAFLIDYLLRSERWKHAFENDKPIKDEEMPDHSYKYLISRMGQWYTIRLKLNGYFCTIKDSLKLIPLSVADMGKAFNTMHRKTEMEYHGYREPGYEPTPEEMEYMKNDVLVVAESISQMLQLGHTKSTIGSNCLKEYKNIIRNEYIIKWKEYFPNLNEIPLDPEEYGAETAEKYIRKSYRGGWCYLAKGKEDRLFENGCTFDVNSLYPSVMESGSGNRYPVGLPTFWKGKIPDEAKKKTRYFFVRIRCRFILKDKKLPFIQIKDSPFYKGTEMLETSDIYIDGKRIWEYEKDGETVTHYVTITLTQTDYYLFLEHYNADIEFLDGCYFDSAYGIFDFYISKYAKIKKESTGGKRQIAKLFLNNLYGQMAKSDDSSYKVARLDEDGYVKFHEVIEHEKKIVYIPIGSAITSYARNFTIRAAQKNYKYFIYADTDSLHLSCKASKVKGIKIHDSDFNCWKLEKEWNTGIFHRQKTYIEIDENGTEIKCAGMPKQSKAIFETGMDSGKYQLTDFKKGLVLEGKLLPKRIRGGIVLQETTFEMLH